MTTLTTRPGTGDRTAAGWRSRRVVVRGPHRDRYDEVLTPAALEFLRALDDAVAGGRAAVLNARRDRSARIGSGQEQLGFRPETAWIRSGDWTVPPAPADLLDRRVEITGPPTRKLTVNALNSGAQGWMADFEDATTPTWDNVIGGQLNLIDALDRRIDFTDPRGRSYRLGDTLPTVHVRPRGWHLVEKHLWLDGRSLSAGVVDAGLYLFHCTRRRLAAGSGPYLYLPKLESAAEARLWNDLLVRAEELLGVPAGTVRTTVLIETLPAAFEMDEILHALGPHATALNAGRWDYLFSVVKTYAGRALVLPDRSALTMEVPFLRAYTDLLVATCHRRGAHAIGGMAAFVPDRSDPERTRLALDGVRRDKQREAGDGFDGSWVAHPGLVQTCREVFDAALPGTPNQLHRRRDDVTVGAGELLDFGSATGRPGADGLRAGISVALRYLRSWLAGSGAVTIDALMEDAATVEIVRSLIWQQVRLGVRLRDGDPVTREWVAALAREQADRLAAEDTTAEGTTGEGTTGEGTTGEHLADAVRLFLEVATGEEFVPFFTTVGYGRHLARPTRRPPAPDAGPR